MPCHAVPHCMHKETRRNVSPIDAVWGPIPRDNGPYLVQRHAIQGQVPPEKAAQTGLHDDPDRDRDRR